FAICARRYAHPVATDLSNSLLKARTVHCTMSLNSVTTFGSLDEFCITQAFTIISGRGKSNWARMRFLSSMDSTASALGLLKTRRSLPSGDAIGPGFGGV